MSSYIPYPYPVLGNSDDVEGNFAPSMTYSLNPSEITLSIRFVLDNDYIAGLIESGRASFLVDIFCGRTYYRKVIKTNDHQLVFSEPAKNLRGKVSVSFYICTNEAIGNYAPSGEPYFVDANDIIAVGGNTSFVAEKEFDPLKAPIRSIVKVAKLDKPQDEFTMLYKDEFITIGIPSNMWALYENVAQNIDDAEMLHASIVLPALMDAIDVIKGKNESRDAEFANAAWAVKLNELCASRNIDMESDTLLIAQKLLNNPVKRALSWYENKNDDDMEDD